jgi:hypothetical protein
MRYDAAKEQWQPMEINTTDDLPTDESEHNEGYINSDDEWGFMEGDSLTLEEVIEQSEAI